MQALFARQATATNNPRPRGRKPAALSTCAPVLTATILLVGCQGPRRLVSYPPDSMLVQYEPATTYSTCLMASVAMAANYLENQRRFTVPEMVAELRAAGGDESRVSDVRGYLAGKGLHLLTLAGRLDDQPEEGLLFWVQAKGYPAICVINRQGNDPAFNHAVVVIGVQASVDSSEIIHYLDPSADQPLYSCRREAFETIWNRSGRAMLVVIRAVGDQPSAVGSGLKADR